MTGAVLCIASPASTSASTSTSTSVTGSPPRVDGGIETPDLHLEDL